MTNKTKNILIIMKHFGNIIFAWIIKILFITKDDDTNIEIFLKILQA